MTLVSEVADAAAEHHPETQVHAFAAIAAFALGVVQLAVPKGTLPHRTLGWIWVVLMLLISASSFLIHGNRMWGPFGPIHILSVFTPIMLAVGVLAARRHRVRAHKMTMIFIFCGALVVAGLFTLVPGRIMHTVVFGS